MARAKQPGEPLVDVELVAVRPGFYANRYLQPGTRFKFSGPAIPRWAAEPGKASPPAPAKPLNGDTKPADAQAAVKAKAAAV